LQCVSLITARSIFHSAHDAVLAEVYIVETVIVATKEYNSFNSSAVGEHVRDGQVAIKWVHFTPDSECMELREACRKYSTSISFRPLKKLSQMEDSGKGHGYGRLVRLNRGTSA
jgi:hypothetical protein